MYWKNQKKESKLATLLRDMKAEGLHDSERMLIDKLKNEDYNEFYKSLSHDFNDPMDWVHSQAEGVLEYTTLFYFPKTAPMDLYRADYKPGVKLFVNRVFITDDE